jgi:hypothetical protein
LDFRITSGSAVRTRVKNDAASAGGVRSAAEFAAGGAIAVVGELAPFLVSQPPTQQHWRRSTGLDPELSVARVSFTAAKRVNNHRLGRRLGILAVVIDSHLLRK